MNFKLKPMEHQLINYELTKEKKYYGNLAEMGTGKSKMLIDVTAHMFKKRYINSILIFCNSGAYQEWKEHHIPTHMPDDTKYEIEEWSSKLSGKKLKKFMEFSESRPKQGVLKIITANIESLAYKRSFSIFLKYVKGSNCLVAIDESSTIKNPKSKRTLAAFKLRDVSVARRILTGSPIDNKPLDAWSQLEFLSVGASGHKSYYSFKTHYADLRPHYRNLEIKDRIQAKSQLQRLLPSFTKNISNTRALDGINYIIANIATKYDFKVFEKAVVFIEQHVSNTYLVDMLYLHALGRINLVSGYKNLDEFRSMLQAICFIVKSADCLDLPEKTYMTRYVELTTEQARLYKQIKEDALAVLSEEKVLTVPMVLTQNIRCQQIVNGIFKPDDGPLERIKHNRLKALEEIIEETDEKILIFSEIVESIQEIEEFLSGKYGSESVRSYYGATSRESRSEAKKAIREGEAKYFITNKTGAHGLTLVEITLMVFYDCTFDAEIDNQVQERIHRIGQTKPVRYIRLASKGTVDEKKIKSLKEKKELSSYLVQSNWKEMF